MTVKMKIPTALRHFVGNQESLQLQGSTVGEVITHLINSYPSLKNHILNESGNLRNFVNIYLNEEDIRYLKNTSTPVKDGDTITIVPAIAGGMTSLHFMGHDFYLA